MRAYVRRDYRQSLFNKRHNRARSLRWILALYLLVFATGALLAANRQAVESELQLAVMSALDMRPEPTAFAAEYAMRGATLFREGRLEDALRLFERALAQQPTNIAYLYEYGKTLIELERANEAVPVADRMIELAPQDVRGHALRASAQKWSAPDQAIQDALRGIDIDPDFAPLYAALAVAYTNIQRFTQALESGQRAIELDPNDSNNYRAYSTPLIFVGRWPEAIEALETAISISPNLTGAYFEVAAQYRNQFTANDPKMAVGIYQHIINNMNPSPADEAKAYLRICETYAGVNNANFARAEPYCRQAIRILPDYGSAYRELGRMQYNRRNYEGAIESFRTCERLQENLTRKDIECWYLRGLAHFWMNQCDDAWNVLHQALEIADRQFTEQATIDNINIGIFNITQLCTNYIGVPTPTVPPPTPIPPTPVGGI